MKYIGSEEFYIFKNLVFGHSTAKHDPEYYYTENRTSRDLGRSKKIPKLYNRWIVLIAAPLHIFKLNFTFRMEISFQRGVPVENLVNDTSGRYEPGKTPVSGVNEPLCTQVQLE